MLVDVCGFGFAPVSPPPAPRATPEYGVFTMPLPAGAASTPSFSGLIHISPHQLLEHHLLCDPSGGFQAPPSPRETQREQRGPKRRHLICVPREGSFLGQAQPWQWLPLLISLRSQRNPGLASSSAHSLSPWLSSTCLGPRSKNSFCQLENSLQRLPSEASIQSISIWVRRAPGNRWSKNCGHLQIQTHLVYCLYSTEYLSSISRRGLTATKNETDPNY